ncbi:MAG TPA: SpoIIE family protein phosphatase [Pyrinomonadaceae bacterium]|jgi:sigma-B regulation protein RsbU (phosphoserine phosphatase)
MNTLLTRRVRFILGGLFFVVMFVYAGANSHQSLGARQSSLGWLMTEREGRVLVEYVAPEGAAAEALRVDDEIVAINGRAVQSYWQAFEILGLEPGSTYTLRVRRAEDEREVALRTGNLTPFTSLMRVLLTIVIPAVFLMVGFAVFILKPYDKQALLLALMFGTFIPSESQFLPFGGYPSWLVGVMVTGGLISTFFAPLLFHFFLVFPERSPLLRRFPRLEWTLYLPNVLLTVPYFAAVNYILVSAPDAIFDAVQRHPWVNLLVSILFVLYVIAGIVSLLVNYRQASRLSRRKLRVVVAGSLAGFAPLVVLVGLGLLSNRVAINQSVFRWLSVAAVVAFVLFPLSFAYAIVRHQVIPIRLIIRRGIRYVFVSRGSKVVEIATVGLALTFLLNNLFRYVRPSPLVIGVVSGVVSVVVWNVTSYLHHRVVAPAIDRHFFRRAYNAQQILSELGQALRVMADTREMTSLVSTKMQDALLTENVSIFLRDEATGDYPCAISSHHIAEERVTVTAEDGLVLPRGAFVLERLRESPQPLTVDFQDPHSWAHALLVADTSRGDGDARQGESETLQGINAALLLPVATKNELLGVISLGPRLGDLPFSREDRQMLMAVAWQMALALENSQLVRRKVEEERLLRELEMATEVQRRLFPARPPEFASLELAGVCHPARGVGGDYYDFLTLDDGAKVGIAVADVAGKGMSAALLMSTVQASLRSQAHGVGGCPTELVSSMNRLLKRSTGSASYASFFYAQFDVRERLLTYVNAGHNPPLLVRAEQTRRRIAATSFRANNVRDGNTTHAVALGNGDDEKTAALAGLDDVDVEACAELLTMGGPVIGLFEHFTYEQGTVEMRDGDVLVAYTDGITEALNSQGEEFGEERLRRLVVASADLCAAALTEKIVATIHEWCRDTPPHDDLTLVVMKAK